MKTCNDIMTKDPVCCEPRQSVADVARLMKDHDIGSVPVVDNARSRNLLGIVTDRDLAMKVVAEGRDARNTKIEEVMTRNPVTCRTQDTLESATETMERRQVRRIPVVDDSGRLTGVIAQADVARRSGEPETVAEVVAEISKPSAVRAG
jgi:CBS domain-containing protein